MRYSAKSTTRVHQAEQEGKTLRATAAADSRKSATRDDKTDTTVCSAEISRSVHGLVSTHHTTHVTSPHRHLRSYVSSGV